MKNVKVKQSQSVIDLYGCDPTWSGQSTLEVVGHNVEGESLVIVYAPDGSPCQERLLDVEVIE